MTYARLGFLTNVASGCVAGLIRFLQRTSWLLLATFRISQGSRQRQPCFRCGNASFPQRGKPNEQRATLRSSLALIANLTEGVSQKRLREVGAVKVTADKVVPVLQAEPISPRRSSKLTRQSSPQESANVPGKLLSACRILRQDRSNSRCDGGPSRGWSPLRRNGWSPSLRWSCLRSAKTSQPLPADPPG